MFGGTINPPISNFDVRFYDSVECLHPQDVSSLIFDIESDFNRTNLDHERGVVSFTGLQLYRAHILECDLFIGLNISPWDRHLFQVEPNRHIHSGHDRFALVSKPLPQESLDWCRLKVNDIWDVQCCGWLMIALVWQLQILSRCSPHKYLLAQFIITM